MAPHHDEERTPLLASQPNRSSGRIRASQQQNDQDDFDFDARFRKWKAAVARKFRGKAQRQAKPSLLITHFDGLGRSQSLLIAKRASALHQQQHEVTSMTSAEFRQQVEQVKHAISKGVYPKMITTGSSGSYFVRIIADPSSSHTSHSNSTPLPPPPLSQAPLTTVAVFKPKDEEPYGNLNPKRQFARKYLWWAMGRPCLIPNFSYLSEVGASYLDSRLALQMVPRTELVNLSSPTFHYAFNDRMAHEKDRVPLPDKIGSYQTFLKGYINASDFLRKHPWPSRTRSKTLLMRDMEDESRAHKVSRKKEPARLRNCGVAIKRALLCRPSWEDLYADGAPVRSDIENGRQASTSSPEPDGFHWTPKRMQRFRLQLERLVVLDFLMRNTDRGLDNFMIKHDADKDEIKIGAIDNSLSFPIKHPNEIRQYPFGWLFLPSDLIGLPFSGETRKQVLPILNDPVWWQHTVQGLRRIFEQDPYFDEAKFERQMSVMRGQGWNLVQSLRAPDEGPLDLCARGKKLIRQEVQELSPEKLEKLEGVKVALDSDGQAISPPEMVETQGSEAGKPPITRTISSGVLETERRPIGMRASESYRKALLQAASTEAISNDEADAEADDELVPDVASAAIDSRVSSSLPHTSILKDKMRDDVVSSVAAQPEPTNSKMLSRGRHHRIASAHDVSTYSRHRQRGAFTSNNFKGADGHDSILGRTGIEILEGLDKERRRQNKVNFFRPRQRSSTVSTDRTEDGKAIHRSRQASEDAGRSHIARRAAGGERSYDLSSSIVSDPGFASSRWPRSKSVSRQGEGIIGSLYDLHSQGEVLSEEEEQEQDQSVGQGMSRRDIPTIQAVLEQDDSEDRTQKNNEGEGAEGSRPTAFTPHTPHPQAITKTDSDDTDSKRTIKVIVEKISSDTKQAWLKWI